jgi:hypothetical protein
MRIVGLDGLKDDLELTLRLYREGRDPSEQRRGILVQLEALHNLAEATLKAELIEGGFKMLEPVRQLCKALGDLDNGRRPELLTPAPRKGKRPALMAEAQEGLRAAAAMDFLVPLIGKKGASKEVARLLRLGEGGAERIDYWRDQGMNGPDDVIKDRFQHILEIWTAKHPNSPEKRAKALIDAHKRTRLKKKSFLEEG